MHPMFGYLLQSLSLASPRGGPEYRRDTFPGDAFNNFHSPCQTTKYATCVLSPDPAAEYKLTGTVYFSQEDNCGTAQNLNIRLSVFGFPSTANTTKHGFHIHTYGDLSSGCTTAGGHYNPFNHVHGDISDKHDRRHVGDFGNLDIMDGKVEATFTDSLASLLGSHSVVGRAIVVHAGEDDLGRGGNKGSVANGNAGPRLACCVIGWSGSPK